MGKVTRTLPFKGGFISPPTSRAQTSLGCPDWNNLCLAPGAATFRPLPGFRRVYPKNLLQTSGTNKNRVVSFLPQAFPFTGSGVGLGVVDEVTGRVTALNYHAGATNQNTSAPASSPHTLGTLNRQGPDDYAATLYFRQRTHFALGFEEQYCWDGSLFRRVGIRAPEFAPLAITTANGSEHVASGLTWIRYPDTTSGTVVSTGTVAHDATIPRSTAAITTVTWPEADNKNQRLMYAATSFTAPVNPRRVGFWMIINAPVDCPTPFISTVDDPMLSFVVAISDSTLTGRTQTKASATTTTIGGVPVTTGIDFHFPSLFYYPMPVRSQGIPVNQWFYTELDLSNLWELDETAAPTNPTITCIGFAISKSFQPFLKNSGSPDDYSFSFQDPSFFAAQYNTDYIDQDPSTPTDDDIVEPGGLVTTESIASIESQLSSISNNAAQQVNQGVVGETIILTNNTQTKVLVAGQVSGDDWMGLYGELVFEWHDTVRQRESNPSPQSNPIRLFGHYTTATGYGNGDGSATLGIPVNLTFNFKLYTDGRHPVSGLTTEAGVINPIPDTTVDDLLMFVHIPNFGVNTATGQPIYRKMGNIPVAQLVTS